MEQVANLVAKLSEQRKRTGEGNDSKPNLFCTMLTIIPNMAQISSLPVGLIPGLQLDIFLSTVTVLPYFIVRLFVFRFIPMAMGKHILLKLG